MNWESAKEVTSRCESLNIPIYEYTIRYEMEKSKCSREYIVNKMKKNLNVMKQAADVGLRKEVKSVSGIIGGDALKIQNYINKKNTLCGEFIVKAMARALSCSEVNAAMGRIVAAPTAGSSGILPAVIITAAEKLGKSEEDMVNSLFTASGIGIIIAKKATLAGAEGGCQAECGSAAAMAAGAVVEMMGGTPEMCFNAGAITIKNIMGLICDPIAGLVEAPCAKRNVNGTVNALTTVDLVMSGVRSVVPFDEVVETMYKVGKRLPMEFKETALGGIAITPTALKLKAKISGKK